MGREKKISRKARPTEQTGSVRRKEQYHRKNRNIASMCEHLEGSSMLEGGGPRNALLLCARKEDNEREREKSTQTQLDLQWECQSDRSQVIGGKLLIGQLAPWVTWDI